MATAKKTIKKNDGLPAVVKYLLFALIIAGIGYGGYLATQANKRDISGLRNNCGFSGGGGGLGSFGSCR